MIASLRGRLVEKTTDGAVIECGGVGYGVAMSLASLTRLGAEGSEVRVLVHTHLSQDALRLYGFADAAEREVFEVLIGTSGVGPRLALAILSVFTPGELADAVANGDRGMLVRVPGVGNKKAERLLVELKGRLDHVTLAAAPARAAGRPELLADLTSALANLGFVPKDADRLARGALDASPQERDLATLVRAALRDAARST